MTDHGYVPFAAPDIGPDEQAAVARVLSGGWLSTGSEAAAFERELASITGRTHAVAVNSCTAALHLALIALGLQPCDEVIVPTVTFTATAAAVVHAGATPVLVDVTSPDLTIDADAVLAAITPHTRAVIVVHMAGRMVDIDAVHAVVADRGIAVIEDAAHALPAYRNGVVAGKVGVASAFSFFATKPITTGEGGMLLTDDPHIEATARLWSLHGLSRGATDRYSRGGSANYDVDVPGYKYNLSDLQASLGRAQLARRDELWQRRRTVAEAYLSALAGHDFLDCPAADTPENRSSWYLFIIRLRLDQLRIDRDQFCGYLDDCGIGTSVHFRPLHTYSYYRSLPSATGRFPVADEAWPSLVSLPLTARMSAVAVNRVIEAVDDVTCQWAR